MRALPAALFALLLAPEASPQDDGAKMEWVTAEGDRFDFKWTYAEQRRREPGRGDVTETHDKRDVDAELAWKAEGVLTLTLKRVVWSYGNQDYDISLNYVQGKKLDPQLKMKGGPTSIGYPQAKADADRMLEYMRKMTDGEFTIDTAQEKGRTLVLWNNGNVRTTGTFSLLGRIFTHPLLPSGPVRVGQVFKDPLEVTNLTAGLTDVREVESKVTAVGDKGLIAKGGVNIPVGASSVVNGQTHVMTGNFTYTCEWNYSPQQYLQGTKEESKFTKKVDAKGKDADFYRENFNHTITQALTIKKKPADPNKKPAPKPDEKKPEEPKPEEKKE
ncbi:MAG TPA: hypothetical protein VM222_04590 [Planctomycetota bacterium]|nr:hypothetical protein [Planctomycetota bacterium]